MITLVLPWPPTVNTLYPTSRSGHRFMSKRGKQYVLDVLKAVISSRKEYDGKPLTGRLGYVLALFPPDKRVRDISNTLKAIEDSLTKAGIWEDDSQVDALRVRRMPIIKNGRAAITIYDIDTECEPLTH